MKYKFRAECRKDVLKFIEKLPNVHLNVKFETNEFKEPVITLESFKLQGLEIVNAMRQVHDSHVMIQTLQLESQYTGERDYTLS